MIFKYLILNEIFSKLRLGGGIKAIEFVIVSLTIVLWFAVSIEVDASDKYLFFYIKQQRQTLSTQYAILIYR